MVNLYLDFDGVIVDTINDTYKMMSLLNINLKDRSKVIKFYEELDWEKMLNNTKEINDAFNNINMLQESGKYNICILTTVNTLNEMRSKVSYIRKKNSKINIICVPRGVEKCNMVDSKGSILVDDYSGNLKTWTQNGGIGIKFSDNNSDEYKTISSLNELLNIKKLCMIKK